jgi:heterotetrameric sarcosine oxidase gamma subunit
MPDRSLFWSPVPDWSRAVIQCPDLVVKALAPLAVWLVSGDVARFAQQRALACFGPREVCELGRYALRLAPDRVLAVGCGAELPGPAAFGWSNEGVAISDVGDGFVLIDITGPAALDLMRLGANYDFAALPAGPAESASMLFAGLKVAVARTAPGWRLHVERPYAAAIWQWLQRAASEWAKPPAGAAGRLEPSRSIAAKQVNP